MILREVKKNKFGGNTWKIHINNEFFLKIYETNDNTFLIELKEANYFMYRTEFALISNKSIEETISDAFDKVYFLILEKRKVVWNELLSKKIEALDSFQRIKENKINKLAYLKYEYNR